MSDLERLKRQTWQERFKNIKGMYNIPLNQNKDEMSEDSSRINITTKPLNHREVHEEQGDGSSGSSKQINTMETSEEEHNSSNLFKKNPNLNDSRSPFNRSQSSNEGEVLIKPAPVLRRTKTNAEDRLANIMNSALGTSNTPLKLKPRALDLKAVGTTAAESKYHDGKECSNREEAEPTRPIPLQRTFKNPNSVNIEDSMSENDVGDECSKRDEIESVIHIPYQQSLKDLQNFEDALSENDDGSECSKGGEWESVGFYLRQQTLKKPQNFEDAMSENDFGNECSKKEQLEPARPIPRQRTLKKTQNVNYFEDTLSETVHVDMARNDNSVPQFYSFRLELTKLFNEAYNVASSNMTLHDIQESYRQHITHELSRRNLNDSKAFRKTLIKFLVEEFAFCIKLKTEKIVVNSEYIDENILDEMKNDICFHIENNFVPVIIENSDDMNNVVESLVRKRKLFFLYQTYFSYFLRNFVTPGNIEKDEYQKKLIDNSHFNSYENFLSDLSQFFPENNFDLIDLINMVGNLKHKVYIRHQNFLIFLRHTLYLKVFFTSMKDVYHIIQHNKQHHAFAVSMMGKMDDIYNEELLLKSDLVECVKEHNMENIAKCLLKHDILFSMYETDVSIRGQMNVKTIYDEHYLRKMFPVNDYLNSLLKFLNNIDNKHYQGVNPDVKKLKLVVKRTTKHLETILATLEIIGSKIDLRDQGDLLLSDKFYVQYEKEDLFDGIVYLFEKAMVFTKIKQRPTQGRHAIYHSHILLTKLVFFQINPTTFTVHFQDKNIVTDHHVITHNDGTHGDADAWHKTVTEQLVTTAKQMRDWR